MTSVDLIFRNGNLFDGTRHGLRQAVAVSQGRVVAVVDESAAADLVGGGTTVVDLAGGLLLPGFQDAHVHPVQGGLERIRCDLSTLDTREEYVAAVADYGEAQRHTEWISGGGWAMPAFGPAGPRAADLDAVVGDRPVFLPNRDHHGAWVNSAALRAAGIDRDTPDPVDGRIERDEAGDPTGTLHEGAMGLVQRLVPAPTEQEYDRALAEAQAYLHSVGVTAWQDAILDGPAGFDDPSPTYLRAIAAGRLTARVRGALWWDRSAGLEQIDGLLRRRSELTRGRLDAGSVKVMQDGVVENYTAAMTTAYRDGCGGPTHNHGLSFVDPATLNEAVTRLAAFESARLCNGASDGRHHIAHLQVVRPEDLERFTALDVAANMQPLWAIYDDQMVELTLPYLDEDAASWQYPFGDLARTGARIVAGSDWPVSSPDPLAGIHVAVNRWSLGEPGRAGSEPFLPEQALSPEQAFAAYTSGSAWVNHLDDTGHVAPGMCADLVVLDRDPLTGVASEIGAAAVRAAYIDGRAVFEA
ncbi:MAG: amidohydrolase [Nocardioidaceae bacterium]|nr:amidohydrolase [Nocardioidaceae bacterium]